MTATVAQSTRPIIADGAELTWEDYLKTPEVRFRYEILEGIVKIMSPAPLPKHQQKLLKLTRLAADYVERNGLGLVMIAPVDIVIRRRPKLKTRQPDMLFFSTARIGSRTIDDFLSAPQIDTAPNLMVEMLSPTEMRRELPGKLADYAAISVEEVWAISREAQTVEVLALQNGQYVRTGLYGMSDAIVSNVLPGLALTVDAIFA